MSSINMEDENDILPSSFVCPKGYLPSSVYLIRGLYKVGCGWQDSGDLKAAERIYRFILNIKERNPLLNCAEFPQTMANLASIQVSAGDYVIAERLYLRAISSCVEILGENHQICADILRDYAILLRHMQLTEEAHVLEHHADAVHKLDLPVMI